MIQANQFQKWLKTTKFNISLNNKDDEYKFADYFLTEKEVRKEKLLKLKHDNKI